MIYLNNRPSRMCKQISEQIGLDVQIIQEKCDNLVNWSFLIPGYIRRIATMSMQFGYSFPELMDCFERHLTKSAEDFFAERIFLDVENKNFAKLKGKARYALNSYNLALVYNVYGMAQAFYELGVITRDQFNQLNEMLVVKGINDPAHCHLE